MSGHATSERLSSYLDDELDADRARRLEDHLRSCASCRRQLDGLRRVMGDLRSLRESSPPAGLGIRLQQRLALDAPPPLEPRGRLRSRSPGPFFQPAVLGSLGVVLALAVILVIFSQLFAGRSPRQFPGMDRAGSTELEPLDRVEVAGRSFEIMGGIWVEYDLTVAEVANARVVDRAELLTGEETASELRLILDRLSRSVTLRVGDEVWRITAAGP